MANVKITRVNETIGISYHNRVVKSTLNTLKMVLGKPNFEDPSGVGKVAVSWKFMYNDGVNKFKFEIYDYKNYEGNPVVYSDETFEFHIGTNTPEQSDLVIDYINEISDGFSVDAYEKTLLW